MPFSYVDFAKGFLYIAVAQFLINCGIYFTSGLLMPKLLSGVYDETTLMVRLIISIVTWFAVGNFVMSYAYGQFSPALYAPVTIFAIVIMQVLFPVLVFSLKPSWMVLPATLLACASCVWVSVLLVPRP